MMIHSGNREICIKLATFATMVVSAVGLAAESERPAPVAYGNEWKLDYNLKFGKAAGAMGYISLDGATTSGGKVLQATR